MAYDISKLQSFADSFATSLASKIEQIEKTLPIPADFIYHKMNMQLTRNGACRAIELLMHAGFVDKAGLAFVDSRISSIDNMNFNELQRYHQQLITICKEVYKGLSSDYSSAINALASSISAQASNYLLQMLQAKVACPLMHEALYKPAQAISAKLTGASAELAKQLRDIFHA